MLKPGQTLTIVLSDHELINFVIILKVTDNVYCCLIGGPVVQNILSVVYKVEAVKAFIHSFNFKTRSKKLISVVSSLHML